MALTATQAAALSCAVPTVAETFARADASDDVYQVVKGVIAFDPAEMPEGGENDAQGGEVTATMVGDALTAEGFNARFVSPITLVVGCAGPWCGTVGAGEQIAFLRQSGGRLELDVSPCPGSSFEATEEVEAAVMACLAGECGAD